MPIHFFEYSRPYWKKIKKSVKTYSIEYPNGIDAVQIFLTGAKLLLMGYRSLRMLGKGIRYIKRNTGVYKHALRQITSISHSFWEGNRGGSRKQFSLLRQTEFINEPTNDICTSEMKGIIQ